MFLDARIGMALIDDHGRYARVNPALCALLGYSDHELVDRRFSELTHPEEREENLRLLAAMRSGAIGGVEIEKRYVARDGSVIWALVNVSPMSSMDAGEGFVVAQVQDISERKRVELALAEERQLLKAFLETTVDQVYFKDLDSRFIRVSDAQAARLGLAGPEDAIGKTDFDVFSEEHARPAFEDEQRIIRTGEPIVDFVERETWTDGREAWVSTSKMPLRDASGEIVGTFGMSRDITQRKAAEEALRESEERWRNLIAHAQEIVVVVDRDGRLVYGSPSLERWLGYDPRELIATAAGLPNHPDDEAALAQAFADAVATGPVSIGHRVRHRDGSWHSLESTLVHLRDDPVSGATLITSRDVTERVALELDRERLDFERRVAQRLQAVGQLAAGIAHEINTPIQFVGDSVTFLNDAVGELRALMATYREWLLAEAPVDPERQRERILDAEEQADVEYLHERIPAAFDRVSDGLARVTSIVQGMRRFAHPATADKAPADLNQALETTLAVCRNEYRYVADVRLELAALPPLHCNIGDLNQVFLNLIVNAAHAIEESNAGTEQRGTITISTRLVGNEAVVVEIADDGAGIPPEVQDRIYEPFFTTKEVGKGTGQGLAIARAIIEQQSGSLTCTSAPGLGTSFEIRLPLEAEPADLSQAA